MESVFEIIRLMNGCMRPGLPIDPLRELRNDQLCVCGNGRVNRSTRNTFN